MGSNDEYKNQYVNHYSADYSNTGNPGKTYADQYNKSAEEYKQQYAAAYTGGTDYNQNSYAGKYGWSGQNDYNRTAEKYRAQYAGNSNEDYKSKYSGWFSSYVNNYNDTKKEYEKYGEQYKDNTYAAYGKKYRDEYKDQKNKGDNAAKAFETSGSASVKSNDGTADDGLFDTDYDFPTLPPVDLYAKDKKAMLRGKSAQNLATATGNNMPMAAAAAGFSFGAIVFFVMRRKSEMAQTELRVNLMHQ